MNNNIFLILFIVFTAIMALCPLAVRRYKIPPVIALLLVGMLISPNCFDLIERLADALTFLGADKNVVTPQFTSFVDSLGALGLVFLMVLAGMEADFQMIKDAKKSVIFLSILTFLIPSVAGFYVYSLFKPDDFAGQLLYASLFASHSVGIVFPVIRELNLAKTRFGASVLISTVITDIASIIMLAVSVQIKRISLTAQVVSHKSLSIFDYINPEVFGSFFTPFFLLIVLIYLVLAIIAVYYIGTLIFRLFKPGEELIMTILQLLILATVLIGELLGINLVVGAFIAGLALSRLVKKATGRIPLIARFESIGYGFLIPFLFISIGMKTDFMAFAEKGNFNIIILTVTGLVASKIFSGWLAMKLSGFDNRQGLVAGLMTVPQLSATLAAAAIGKELGMLDNTFFNAIIILSIVTTLPIPTLVKIIIERSPNQFAKLNKDEYYEIPNAVKKDDLL